ncbi:MAG: type-F conjugative transfer system pilin assembly protein TrbC [Pseudomonadota bacterium]
MTCKLLLSLGLFAACGAVSTVLAQSVSQDNWSLDLSAIEARADSQKKEAQEVFDYAIQQAEAQRSDAQETVQEGFDAAKDVSVETSAKAGEIDLDAMLAGAQAAMAEPKGSPLFIAFVSLSMPEEALARVIAETSQAGGVVVFRGFSADDPAGFAAGIQAVVDQQAAGNLAIDPRLFRSFDVNRVPTFVALSRGFDPCDQLDCVTAPPPHDRIAGNVSARHVLETFADANGPGAPVARQALANLRAKP